jgi:hypothetical protein
MWYGPSGRATSHLLPPGVSKALLLGIPVDNCDSLDFPRILGFRFSGYYSTIHDGWGSQAKGNRTSRVIYVGAVILQALSMSPQKQDVALERCTGCISDLERRFATDLGGNCALSDADDYLTACIEVSEFIHLMVTQQTEPPRLLAGISKICSYG